MFCGACDEDDLCCDDIEEVKCSIRIKANLKPYDKCCYVCELKGDTEKCSNPCSFQRPEKE